jgi:hypothetical protein
MAKNMMLTAIHDQHRESARAMKFITDSTECRVRREVSRQAKVNSSPGVITMTLKKPEQIEKESTAKRIVRSFSYSLE